MKINFIKIMAGAVLIASIGYYTIAASTINENPAANEFKPKNDITNIVKSDDTSNGNEAKTDITSEKSTEQNDICNIIENPEQKLDTHEQIKSYTVKAGDTLYSISKKFNISLAKLKEINNLAVDNIYAGQNLSLIASESISTPISPPAQTIDNLVLVNKTHPLPSTYVPSSLVNPRVLSANSLKTRMTQEAAKALEALFSKAKQDNIKLMAISGYRSYSYQESLFASNVIKYGSVEAANQFSAKPGQSEHQTGLAMDVSSSSVNYALTQSFGQTREGIWIKENAPKFGFIVRYLKDKESITGYQYEPWHLRYVGKSAALEIASRNITLEEYLGK